jgi:hypothetical protein
VATQEDVARRIVELQWAELSSRAKVEAELLRPAHALEVLPRFSILIAEDYLAEFYGTIAQSLLPAHESFIGAQAAMEHRSRETIRRLFMIDAPRRSYAASTASTQKKPSGQQPSSSTRVDEKKLTAASPPSPPPLDTERVTSGDSTRDASAATGNDDADDDGAWEFSDRGRAQRPANPPPQAAKTSPQSNTANVPSPSRSSRPLISGAAPGNAHGTGAALAGSPKFGRRAAAAAAGAGSQREVSQPVPTRRRR